MLSVGNFSISSHLIDIVKTWPKQADQMNAYAFLYDQIKAKWQSYMERYYHSHKHSYAIKDDNVIAASQSLDYVDYTRYLWQPNIDTAKINTEKSIEWFIDPSIISDILYYIGDNCDSEYYNIQNEFESIIKNDFLDNSKFTSDFLNNYRKLIEGRK